MKNKKHKAKKPSLRKSRFSLDPVFNMWPRLPPEVQRMIIGQYLDQCFAQFLSITDESVSLLKLTMTSNYTHFDDQKHWDLWLAAKLLVCATSQPQLLRGHVVRPGYSYLERFSDSLKAQDRRQSSLIKAFKMTGHLVYEERSDNGTILLRTNAAGLVVKHRLKAGRVQTTDTTDSKGMEQAHDVQNKFSISSAVSKRLLVVDKMIDLIHG